MTPLDDHPDQRAHLEHLRQYFEEYINAHLGLDPKDPLSGWSRMHVTIEAPGVQGMRPQGLADVPLNPDQRRIQDAAQDIVDWVDPTRIFR